MTITSDDDPEFLRAVDLTREALKHIDHAISFAEDVQRICAAINDELPAGTPDKARLTGARVDLESAVRRLEPKRLRVVRGGNDAG